MISFMVPKQATIFLLLLHCIASSLDIPLVLHHNHMLHIEKAALLAFKSSITPHPPLALANWNESTNVCRFFGVGCNRWRVHVVRLELSQMLIRAPLSPVLANLTGLRELDLSGNHLTGHIPESFSLLKSLRYVSLASNSLEGPIPASIFHNCTSLGLLDLSDNNLSGSLPAEVVIQLPFLIILDLYLNDLSGEIPSWLSNSSFLQQLDIENNHVSGELPSGQISHWKQLEVLHLSYTNLYSHDHNTNLEPFFLALSNTSELRELEVTGIGLGGRLPHRIGQNMTRLSIANLDDNKIFGPVPPDIALLSNITLLNLSTNLLNGTIPKQIGELSVIERLILSNNLFSGVIPMEIGNIVSVGLLDLSNNRLSGGIPNSLGNLSRISELYLHKNQFSGEIPIGLGNCQNLNKLDLSYNRLTGRIPEEISGIAKIFLNLSHNFLHGTLPIALAKMDQVQEIDLSSNRLTGEILPQLSECSEVKLINLSHNFLQGQLPESLGNLRNLETLDVSFNSLSGQIPLSLNSCSTLTELNLSYNDFSGMIPPHGILSSFDGLSFLGNPHLCGLIIAQVCPHHKKLLRSHKFLITISGIAVILALLPLIVCFIRVRRINLRTLIEKRYSFGYPSPVFRSRYPRITYRELVEATGEFRQDGLVGSGSYGHVYRGVLRDGTVVAVKVLQFQTSNSTKSFNRECQVLKRIRHRNLMRIITACSLPDFKALVLPFMANGNLESRLYDGGSCNLSLDQRVNILSDVAEGMAYLHHHSPVKVIHCDLKPSNVLLNDDMTALVSDFGIARLVMTSGVGNTVEADNVGSSTASFLCGSIGYIAPEYGFGSSPSTKGDVYSFGVVVLEVVTRKRPTDEMFQDGLNKWVREHLRGRVDKEIDDSLMSTTKNQAPEVRRMWEVATGELIELGLLCTQESPSTRPTMLDAADDLNRLKRYLAGDTTATFASSVLGMSSSTVGEE